jgi:hypothetical protein
MTTKAYIQDINWQLYNNIEYVKERITFYKNVVKRHFLRDYVIIREIWNKFILDDPPIEKEIEIIIDKKDLDTLVASIESLKAERDMYRDKYYDAVNKL